MIQRSRASEELAPDEAEIKAYHAASRKSVGIRAFRHMSNAFLGTQAASTAVLTKHLVTDHGDYTCDKHELLLKPWRKVTGWPQDE